MSSQRSSRKTDTAVAPAVARYKNVLRQVLDNRPSGTRQKLALALGKNRSFISQISSPLYPVPIPVQHLETLFGVCHFAPHERDEFLAAYAEAHHTRMRAAEARPATRNLVLTVPDLGSVERNHRLDELVAEMVRSLVRHIELM
ncbi:hypothetical protein [Niveibacterium sp. SC-1]|uniref:hypothetical protein n=1 Tax=Niveibacterium sp. SC-1 TaxID=3135646 RepID=UPI00311F8095